MPRGKFQSIAFNDSLICNSLGFPLSERCPFASYSRCQSESHKFYLIYLVKHIEVQQERLLVLRHEHNQVGLKCNQISLVYIYANTFQVDHLTNTLEFALWLSDLKP